MKGWVYVATMNNVESVVKLGCTVEDPIDVINTWAVNAGIPNCAVLAYAALVENPLRVEVDAHRHLKDFNTKGDWFRISADKAMLVIRSNLKAKIFTEKGLLIDHGS